MGKFLGLVFVSVFLLVGCESNKEVSDSEENYSAEVSRTTLSSISNSTLSSSQSNSVENAQERRSNDDILSGLKSEKNKKLTKAFMEAGLEMYGNTVEGPGENPKVEAGDPNGYPESEIGMSFYTTPGTEGLIITIENFSTIDLMEQAILWHKENKVFPVITIVKNQNTKSIMFSYIDSSSEEYAQFEEYAKVFESTK